MSALYDEFADYLRAHPDVLMPKFVRGQRAKLDQLAADANAGNARQFSVQIEGASASIGTFDFVCFGLDAAGKLSDDRYMVFFNQHSAPDDAIALDELGDKRAQFRVDLDKLPASITRLVFTLSIDGAGAMRDLGASELTLRADGKSLMSYAFSGADFSTEGALMLAEVYQKDGVWRAWASGQGFAGDLGALLEHFGGEVADDSAASSQSQSQGAPVAASPSAPVSATSPATATVPLAPTPPSAPVSSPAISSVPVNAPTPVVVPAAVMGELQQTIDGAPVGATIQLPPGEYRGPITLNRALTIEGAGAVIWAQSGPVVAVKSAGVHLRGVQIEATGESDEIALWAEGTAPTLQNVGVRGRVVGMTNEAAGEWKLPASLDLGEFAPRALNSWRFEIEVPVDCRLKVGISGLQVKPTQIGVGRSEIEIVAQGIGPDTFLAGQIEVEHAGLVRPIALSGRAASADKNVAAVAGKRL